MYECFYLLQANNIMDYLIWIQNLRGEWGEGVEKFFTLFTDGSMAAATFIMSIFFWCINKRGGKFLFIVYAFGRVLTQFLKNTFCVYRPFILDSNINPVESAMKAAQDSYSFPSGHVNMATMIYGGLAYFYGRKFPILVFSCTVMIVAIAFSRNFLGVHTLQDVLAAIISTALLIVFVDKLMAWIGGDEKKESWITVGGIILGLIATAYFMLKSYPVDYLDGKIIVEPAEAIKDALGNIGSFSGVIIGLELERRFVKFSTDIAFSKRIFRAVIGVAIILAINYFAVPFIKSLDIGMATKFVRWFTLNIFITFFIPLIFSKLEKIFFKTYTIGGSYYG